MKAIPWRAASIAAAALALVGCNDDDAEPTPPSIETNPPVTTAASSTQPPPTSGSPGSIGGSGTTQPPATASPTTEPTPPTLVPQVPGALDPNDPNNQRPEPTPEQQPIVNAYLRALGADHAFFSSFPRDPQDPVLIAAPLTGSLVSTEQTAGARYDEARLVLDVSGGITYRPYMVDQDTRQGQAIVYDCQLDALVWRNVDTGDVVDPPTEGWPNTGPDIATPAGIGAVMVQEDGQWLLDSVFLEDAACA